MGKTKVRSRLDKFKEYKENIDVTDINVGDKTS